MADGVRRGAAGASPEQVEALPPPRRRREVGDDAADSLRRAESAAAAAFDPVDPIIH